MLHRPKSVASGYSCASNTELRTTNSTGRRPDTKRPPSLASNQDGCNKNIVFLLLLNYQWHTDRNSFYGTCIVLGGSMLVELVYRGITKRGFIQRELALLKKEKETLRSEMSEELDQLLHKK